MNINRYIVNLLFLFVLGGSAFSSEAPTRPEYFGRSLPYLIFSPNQVSWPASVPVGPGKVFPLHLRVTALGRVDTVALLDSLPSRTQQPVREMIENLRFEPGTIDGRVTSSYLRASLILHGGGGPPSLIYPVDSTGKIGRPDLYFASIALNGVVLPRLVDFPSFGCYFKQGDSSGVVPTAVVAIDLDSTGEVAERFMLLSNRLLPDDQILSATLWSKFEPAVVDGIPRPSRVYLTASCFPLLNYPNDPLAPTRDTARSFFREYQVQVRHDTLGWLLPAIPRFDLSKDVIVNTSTGGVRDGFSVRMLVDTAGESRAGALSPHSSQLRLFANRLMKELKFYPAIDFHGRPIPFSGLTHVGLSAAPKVRIEYYW